MISHQATQNPLRKFPGRPATALTCRECWVLDYALGQYTDRWIPSSHTVGMAAADAYAWCPSIENLRLPMGGSWTVEQPLRGREWVSDDGVHWRQRMGSRLDARKTRHLLAHRRPRVFHVYDTIPHEHVGPGLDALVGHLEDFWAGRLHPMAGFEIGEFRSPDGDVMLMVQEYC